MSVVSKAGLEACANCRRAHDGRRPLAGLCWVLGRAALPGHGEGGDSGGFDYGGAGGDDDDDRGADFDAPEAVRDKWRNRAWGGPAHGRGASLPRCL
jgi:hypothetical protein